MLVGSVGVHLVLWPLGDQVLQATWVSPPLPAAGGIMEVSLLGPEDEEPEPSPPLRPPLPPSLPGQLVEPDRVVDETPPPDSDRISELDSRVDQETRAPLRDRASVYDPSQVGERSGRSSASSQPVAQEVPPHALPLGRLNPGDVDAQGHRVDPSDVANGDVAHMSDRVGATAPAPRLGGQGTAEAMRKTFGGSGSFDDLEGVEPGTESLINTHRFKYASFFNRMRDQIAQHWDPNEVMHRLDPDGRTYGQRTRKTLLHITLTPKGAVKRVRILNDSGVLELDKEAIGSVNLAAPFVNPPPQMIDPRTGFIEIDFMFILQDGKQRIRRYLR
ncbi:MAG: energy transducer TonB [Deltaproteobacteria bacterium]|nr:energy transducer TonB [Deltaproteobacteria bacterium]